MKKALSNDGALNWAETQATATQARVKGGGSRGPGPLPPRSNMAPLQLFH